MFKISSDTFNDVTEQLRGPLAKCLGISLNVRTENQSTLNNTHKVRGSYFATWH